MHNYYDLKCFENIYETRFTLMENVCLTAFKFFKNSISVNKQKSFDGGIPQIFTFADFLATFNSQNH